MTAADAVVAGRAAAEARMVDSCRIDHPGAPAQFDPVTGVLHPAPTNPVYEGPCEVQVTDSLNAQDPTVGERSITLLRSTVKVPVGVRGIRVNDVVTIVEVGPASDPDLVGRRFTVEATHAKTYATARRLQCEETR